MDGNPYANANSDANGHCYMDANPYSYVNRDAYGYCNPNANSYIDPHHVNGVAYFNCYPNPDASPDLDAHS